MNSRSLIHAALTGVLMLALLLGPAAADQHYYVDADHGQNGMLHNGSAGDPWLTITHALGRTSEYGSSGNPLFIHVAAGSYDTDMGGGNHESFPLQLGSYTSLVGAGSADTIIDAELTGASVIWIMSKDYVSVEGLTVKRGAPPGLGIGAGLRCQSSHYVTIKECLVTLNNGIEKGAGILFDTCSNIIVKSCQVTDNRIGGEGIDAEGAGIYMINCGSEVLIEDCVISGNRDKENGHTRTLHGGGVACYSTSPVFRRCRIEDNSSADDGAGIYMEDCPAGVLIENCEITRNVSRGADPYGCAGLQCESSDYVTIKDCLVTLNEGNKSGGILFDTCSNVIVKSCQVTDNSVGGNSTIYADALGAGIGMNNCGSEFLIEDCEISGNNYRAYTNLLSGAGVYCYNTSPIFRQCRIENNSCYGYGGGIYMGHCELGVLIEDCEITGNANNRAYPYGGGGFASEYSPATFINTQINNNDTPVDTNGGGGRITYSTVEFNDCEMKDNTASDGGAVYMANATVTFRGTTISGNKVFSGGVSANRRGGGVNCEADCILTIENSTLEGNEAEKSGGAVYIARNTNVSIKWTEILNNKAGTAGGGISLSADFTYPIGPEDVKIEHCMIAGNECAGTDQRYGGGGLNCNSYASPTIFNSLIVNNRMSAYSESAGVYCRNASSPVVLNCTIADNQGHGVHAVDSGCTATLTNCILWNNGDDIVNVACSQISHCDIQDEDCKDDPDVNLYKDPLFVPRDPADPENKYTGYYLAQVDAQAADSPCLNEGDDQASAYGLDAYTTCTDGRYDEGTVDIGYHYSKAYDGSDDTYIELASFEAKARGRSILITWETGTEIDDAGFDLYRVEAGDRTTPRRINERMIPAKGSPAAGASYEFIDADVRPGVTYSYYLLDVGTDGTATWHGPVSARVPLRNCDPRPPDTTHPVESRPSRDGGLSSLLWGILVAS